MTDKMRLEGLTLTVESVQRSLDFYSGKLGLPVAWNSVPAFAMLRLGAGTIGLLALAEAQKEGVEVSSPAQNQNKLLTSMRTSGNASSAMVSPTA